MALERDVQRIAVRFFTALDTPRSLSVKLLMEAGEWDQLVNLSVDPLHYREDVFYHSLDKYRRDRASTDLLRKCVDIDTTVDRKRVAEETFFKNEAACLGQNRFLNDWLSLEDGVITTPQGAPAGMVMLRKKTQYR